MLFSSFSTMFLLAQLFHVCVATENHHDARKLFNVEFGRHAERVQRRNIGLLGAQGFLRHATNRHLMEIESLFSIDVCQCDYEDKCIETPMIGLLVNDFRLCLETTQEETKLDSLKAFEISHGSTEQIVITKGDLTLESNLMFRYGEGTEKLLLSGLIYRDDESLMWNQILRSFKAIMTRDMDFTGTVVMAHDDGGEMEDVSFNIRIPLARFRPIPFLSGEGATTRIIIFGCIMFFSSAVLLVICFDVFKLGKFLSAVLCAHGEGDEE